MLVVMTGYAGDSGSRRLLEKREDFLQTRLSAGFLKRCREILPSEGEGPGVFESLWRLGEQLDCGLRIRFSRIPVKQESIEICELLEENPYELPMSGRIYAYAGEAGLLQEGVVIGETTEAKARILEMKEGIRYLNRPETESC